MAMVCLHVLATCLLLGTYGLEAVVVDDQTGHVLLPHRSANAVLRRQRRYNTGRLEEVHRDNLERECMEERCTMEEARECFEDNEKTMEFWASYIDGDQCKESPCQNQGLCKDGINAYFCFCQPDYSGKNCEIEIAKQCSNNNGGCAHFCAMQQQRAVCQCARGYKLKPDRKSCESTELFACGHVDLPAVRVETAGRSLASDPELKGYGGLMYGDYNGDPFNDYQGSIPDLSRPLTSGNTTAAVPTEAGPTEAGPTEAGPTEAGPTEAGPTEAWPTEAWQTDVPRLMEVGPTEAWPTKAWPTDVPHLMEEGVTEAWPTDVPHLMEAGQMEAGPTEGGQAEGVVMTKAGGIPHWKFYPTVGAITSQDDQDQRIIGGNEATPGEIPWQVSLMSIGGTPFCGGTLLSESWVITAAHCLTELKLTEADYIVRLGEHDMTVSDGHERDHAVAQQVLHPHYNDRRSRFNHDMALLRLAVPVELSARRRPVCLGPKDFTEQLLMGAKTSRVSGWGKINAGQMATRLQKLEVPYVDRTACKSSSRDHITRFMFCAGYDTAPMDACQGDSGGPHVTNHQGTWFLTGIVSWGEDCAKAGKYGVYTRVSRYYTWIGNITGMR